MIKKGYDIFFDAYVMAKALNESVIAEQSEIDEAKESLKIALDSLTEKPEYIKVEKIELSAEKEELEIGEQIKVTGVIIPDNATDKTLNWETSDSEVLEVDENGTVTAIKEGKASIKAISPDNVQAELIFTVKEKIAEKEEENSEVEVKPEDNNGKENLPNTGAGVAPIATVALVMFITNIGFYLNKKKYKK